MDADFRLKPIPQRRAKRCYELAGRAILDLGRGARLVHGVISVDDLHWVPHAWIERGSEAWEPVRNQWMPAEMFVSLFKPKVGCRYSLKEASRLMVERRHWGTWHSFPPYYFVTE